MNYQDLAITVTQLNNYIKEKIANDEFLKEIFIKGEISNFKHHYTGHLYFTLKDENCLVKCIMFKTYAQKLKFEPKDGAKVIIYGNVSVFERDGVYQIYAKIMEEDGIGSLYKEYEELKLKLEQEGLFKIEHKQKIPKLPKIVGVLTSQTGSVIRDIINVGTRRDPKVRIRLYPVPVQGEGAAIKIAEGRRYMNTNKLADVLIIARGGGSIEDLWPFNEEIVAREIYNSQIPIISAVGHETDFTIADFVADLRAPTPSAGADLAIPDREEIKQNINITKNRLKVALNKKIEMEKLRYQKCMASSIFKDPSRLFQDEYYRLDKNIKDLEKYIKNKKQEKESRFIEIIAKLDTLSPLKTLTRGYSLVEKSGKIIKNKKELKKDDIIDIRFSDGKQKVKVI